MKKKIIKTSNMAMQVNELSALKSALLDFINKANPQAKPKFLTKEEYNSIKVGDVIERTLVTLPMLLTVDKIEGDVISAELWEFDRNTGREIDDDISGTVSYISKIIHNDSE